MPEIIRLSPLQHTWILDLDGTLVRHNGYREGKDKWLPGALEFLKAIPEDDFILLLTAREEAAREQTLAFLEEFGVRFNSILFEIPMGERILVNDTKPSGLPCAHCIKPQRNEGLVGIKVIIDQKL